jgi:hypothetical protein
MPKRSDLPRYYRVRRKGRAFWEPGKQAEAFGLRASEPLGADGPGAKAKAIHLNDALDQARAAVRSDAAKPPEYPPGSLGAFFLLFQSSEAWGQMEAVTREDYFRAWPVIAPRFGRAVVSRITPDDSERFHVDIHPAHKNPRDKAGALKLPWNTAHRTLKVWRALLTALVDYRVIPPPAPIGRVTNPKPPGRSSEAHLWLWHEVEALIAEAQRQGKHGLAVAIAIAWDAMLSPVDVRQLKRGEWRRTPDGGEIVTRREKTDTPVFAVVGEETACMVDAYLAALLESGIALDPDAWMIRSARGAVYAVRHTMSADFRDVRAAIFPADRRQMLDLRRSAATEAREGGATLDDIGATMANTLGRDTKLQSTYVLATSKKVLSSRAAGRAKLAAKFRNADP